MSKEEKIKILSIEPIKSLDYIKGYKILYLTKSGKPSTWELASRGSLARLENEIYRGKRYTDGAMIFAVDAEKEKVVLLKEFRVSAGRYVYSLPAGLMDPGESIEETAVREFKEETGMAFKPVYTDRSRYVSVGLVNECVNIVYGYYEGEPSRVFLSDQEDATAFVVDRNQAKKLLDHEEVTARTAYLIQHFFKLNPFLDGQA